MWVVLWVGGGWEGDVDKRWGDVDQRQGDDHTNATKGHLSVAPPPSSPPSLFLLLLLPTTICLPCIPLPHVPMYTHACAPSCTPQGGLRPHVYCLPILKRERHREAVAAAATSGCSRVFLGTDSAPHAIGAKLSACGCAGVFSAPHALALYATAFEEVCVCVCHAWPF
jgi:hypothetical protein